MIIYECIKVRGQSTYIGKSFESIVEEEIEELERLGIQPETDPSEFQNKLVSSRPMGHGGHSIVAR